MPAGVAGDTTSPTESPAGPSEGDLRVISRFRKLLGDKIQIGSYRMSFLPRFRLEGRDFRILPHVEIQRFIVQSGLWGILRRKKLIEEVRLEGLEVTLAMGKDAGALDQKIEQVLNLFEQIRTVVAIGTVVRILPSDGNKTPAILRCRELTLNSIGAALPMNFDAAVACQAPSLEIRTAGTLGPWVPGDAHVTPVSGTYTAAVAGALSTMAGLDGEFVSTGVFTGTLGELKIAGSVRISRPESQVQPPGVDAQFHAVVRPQYLSLP